VLSIGYINSIKTGGYKMQPDWKLIANLGDVNPFEHGAVFIFTDKLGNYDPEMVVIQWDDDTGTGYESRIILEKLSLDKLDQEWFYNDIESAANFTGRDKEALEIGLCSEDVIDRAIAYLDLYYYNGMGGESEEITRDEAIQAYGDQYEKHLTC